MNLAKKPGLTEIRFTALLPGRAYSFVQTEGGFREPEYFLNRFKEYKASAKPVQMILFRRLADGKQKFCGNTEVLLEEYTVTEKGGEQRSAHSVRGQDGLSAKEKETKADGERSKFWKAPARGRL